MTAGLRQALARRAPVHLAAAHLAHERTETLLSFGLARSGQHVVIGWICHCLGRVVHFNHCRFAREGLAMSLAPWTGRRVVYDAGTLDDSGPQGRERLLPSLPSGRFDHLLYSMEDVGLEDPRWRRLARRARTRSLLIVRDPFNWLASRVRTGWAPPARLPDLRDMAKQHLRQALGRVDHLGVPTIAVSYNRFVNQPAYRETLAAALGTEVGAAAEASLSTVPDFGGGGSFTGRVRPEAQQVLSRWRELADDPAYRQLARDPELFELTEALFPELPDLPEIRRRLGL